MRDTHVNLQAAYALAALACNTPRRTMGAMDTYRKWLVRVGAAIRQLREDRKMTQVSLALEVEVDQSNLSRLEKGQQGFDASTLYRIAEKLAVTPSQLLALAEPTVNRDPYERGRSIEIAQALQMVQEVIRPYVATTPDDDEEPDQEHQGHSQPEHGRLLSATRHHNTKKFLSVCA